jgi:small subunit ribosomal protein S1
VSKSKEERLLDKAADRVIREKKREEEKEAEDFAEIIQKCKNLSFPKRGEIIEVKVVQTTKEGILLDIGAKSEGFMPWGEFNGKKEETLPPGKTLKVYVLPKSEGNHILLSKKEADFRLEWTKFEEAFKQSKPIVVRIEKMVRGGFLTRLNSLDTFLPASHISLRRRENLKKFVGEKISVRVIELNKKSKNIVLSRKILLLEEKEERRKKTLDSLEEGQIVTGKVNSVTKFGIFVDLGGIDGLVYPENLSWGWVKDPGDLISKGDKLKLKVLKLDKEKGKISLGLKQTKPDPWKEVEKKYEMGSIVSGKVTHLTDFGAFVEIEKGVEGLIHLSDLSWDKRIEHPKEILGKEKKVEVKVLNIDTKKRKISLGLKQTKPDPWKELLQEHKVGDMVSGKVQQITNFGVFVNLAPGIDGMIHVSELDEEYVPHPEKIALVGDDIKAEIVEINREKRRIRLSVRRLMETKRKREEIKKEGQRKRPRKRRESVTIFSSSGKDGIVIGDFIEEKIKEKLRRSF